MLGPCRRPHPPSFPLWLQSFRFPSRCFALHSDRQTDLLTAVCCLVPPLRHESPPLLLASSRTDSRCRSDLIPMPSETFSSTASLRRWSPRLHLVFPLSLRQCRLSIPSCTSPPLLLLLQSRRRCCSKQEQLAVLAVDQQWQPSTRLPRPQISIRPPPDLYLYLFLLPGLKYLRINADRASTPPQETTKG